MSKMDFFFRKYHVKTGVFRKFTEKAIIWAVENGDFQKKNQIIRFLWCDK